MRGETRAAFITTTDHNVGDDLVREGILYLLEKKLGNIRPALIHKHFPVTVRDRFEWLQSSGCAQIVGRVTGGRARLLSRFLDTIPLHPESDKILSCDLLVQSGAPVYWCFPDGSGCHTNEWFRPLIEKRYLRIKDEVPLINIGAGSCQPYKSSGSEFLENAACSAYIRRLHSLAAVTTVRDSLARAILHNIGLDAPLIPCPSLFARDRLRITPEPAEFVAVNFMPLGGHYGFGQLIDEAEWQRTFVTFCTTIGRRHPVVLVCHDRKELGLAMKILPNVKRMFADSSRSCLSIYSRARCYIGSRIHGAFATASFGRPAFVIGSDSRSRMMDEISLSDGFVAEMTPEFLLTVFGNMNDRASDYREVSEGIRETAYGSYMSGLDRVTDLIRSRCAQEPERIP